MFSGKSQRLVLGLTGVLGSAVFIYLAVRHLDWEAVSGTWRESRPLPWVPLAVLAYLMGHLVRGQRLRLLVQREATLRLPTASNVVVVGYASNNVLPLRLGELVRAGMLAERTGIPISQALTVTFIERLLDGIAILALLMVSTLTTERAGWIQNLARLGSIVFGIALVVVLIAVYVPNILIAMASRLGDRAIGLATNIVNGGACLRRPTYATAMFLLSLCVWLLESMMFVLILPAFSLPMHLSTGVVAMSVTNLGILVPSTPGYAGPFHFFCSQALISRGTDPSTAFSYAVLVHLTFYVPVTLWGGAAVAWYGTEVGRAAAMARSARSSPKADTIHGVPMHVISRMEPEAVPLATGDFYLALTLAVLPDVRVPQKQLEKVAAFVKDEMAALPPRLRGLFELGMTGFRAYVRLRYFSSFCGLSPERRREAVQAWAFGRIALLRQLFRPVRSTALLAYYEMPEVLDG